MFPELKRACYSILRVLLFAIGFVAFIGVQNSFAKQAATFAVMKEFRSVDTYSKESLLRFFGDHGYRIKKHPVLLGQGGWLDINDWIVVDGFAWRKGSREILVFSSSEELRTKRYGATPAKRIILNRGEKQEAFVVSGKNIWKFHDFKEDDIDARPDNTLLVIFTLDALYVADLNAALLSIYSPIGYSPSAE